MRSYYDEKTREVYFRGVLVGHAVRKARVAAGTKGARTDRGTLADGTRKHFWTAVPATDHYKPAWWRPGDGTSIGTRFATLEDAMEALFVYHVHYRGSLSQTNPEPWSAYRKAHWGF